MRLIEKLAEEYDPLSLDEWERDAFKAGFRKALELAESAIRKSCSREKDSAVFVKVTHSCADLVEFIGQEEVE